jgi:hypothetical protein
MAAVDRLDVHEGRTDAASIHECAGQFATEDSAEDAAHGDPGASACAGTAEGAETGFNAEIAEPRPGKHSRRPLRARRLDRLGDLHFPSAIQSQIMNIHDS